MNQHTDDDFFEALIQASAPSPEAVKTYYREWTRAYNNPDPVKAAELCVYCKNPRSLHKQEDYDDDEGCSRFYCEPNPDRNQKGWNWHAFVNASSRCCDLRASKETHYHMGAEMDDFPCATDARKGRDQHGLIGCA